MRFFYLRRLKLRRAERDRLLFVREDDPIEPITKSMVQHWHGVTCKEAKIEDFLFRDWRACLRHTMGPGASLVERTLQCGDGLVCGFGDAQGLCKFATGICRASVQGPPAVDQRMAVVPQRAMTPSWLCYLGYFSPVKRNIQRADVHKRLVAKLFRLADEWLDENAELHHALGKRS
jgi:hypothetical protein